MAPFKVLLVVDNADDRALEIHELQREFGELKGREINGPGDLG